MGSTESEIIKHTVTIIADPESEEKVNLEIRNFSFSMGGQDLKDVDLIAEGIVVTEEEDEYKLTGSPLIYVPELGILPFSLEGKVDTDKKLSFILTAQEDLVEVEFYQDTETGINSIGGSEFSIYPTTTYDVLNVEGVNENSKYAIYNVAGLLVKKGIVESTINVVNLNKGIYIIQIEGYTNKFIKK